MADLADERVSQLRWRSGADLRRQMTYWRHQLPVAWVDWLPEMSAETVTERNLGQWRIQLPQ